MVVTRAVCALLVLVAGCSLVDAIKNDSVQGSEALRFETGAISTMGQAPKTALLAELNGLTGPDVVVLDQVGEIIKCSNDGTGTRFETAFFPASDGPPGGWTLIAAGDIDGDGIDDVVAGAANVLDVLVPILANPPFTRHAITPPVQTAPLAITTIKLADGTRSIGAAYTFNMRVVSDPLGTPSTSPPVGVTVMPGPTAYKAFIAGNVAGSGDDELIATQHVDGQLVEWTGAPNFDQQSVRVINDGVASALAAGDLIGSGTVDVAFIGLAGQRAIGIMEGSPSGLSDSNVRFGDGVIAEDLQLADFDGDGRLDIAVLYKDEQSVSRLRLFMRLTGTVVEQTIALEGNPESFAAGDINGDGRADVLLVPDSNNGVGLLRSQQ